MAAAPFVAEDALAPLGNGRFALAFVGAIMGLSAFICTFLFRSRNRLQRELLAGRELLAKWTYTDTEWRAYAGEETRAQSSTMNRLLWFTAIFMAAVTGVYVLRDGKAGVFVGASLLVAFVLAWLAARATLKSSAVARGGPSPEVRIGRDGLLIGGELHVWRGWGNVLNSCALNDGPTLQLVINYMTPSGNKTALRPETVRVLVPAGKETEAREVVRQLSS